MREGARTRVALYCRLSEEDRGKQRAEEDSGSIANQKAMLRDYANDRGWEICGIYSDDDYTGSDRNRPAFRRLIADAEARRFDVVLCKSQSRFTRELELVERYIHGLFPLWGIRFVGVVDNADTENRGNKKARQINGLVNEWYLEDLSDSIRAALDSRRSRGFHIGSFAAYGYRKDPLEKGRLLIDEEAASVVREVFTLFAEGYGKMAIARMLNERGIPNPTEYKRLRGLCYQHPQGKCGTLWKYYAISSMLRNEIYVGTMVQGRYESVSYKTSVNRPRPREKWFIVEGTHEAIIERALWDRVQRMLDARAKPFSDGTLGLFAGKARCAVCGYTLRSSVSGGKRYLMCPTRYASKNACAGAFISVDRLERIVVEELRRLSAVYLDREMLAREIGTGTASAKQRERLQRECSDGQARVEEVSREIRTLYLDKAKGLLAERDFIALSAVLSSERERLEAQNADRARRLKVLQEDAEVEGRVAADRCAYPERLTRAYVEDLVDEIRVGTRIAGTREVPIEIYWTF